MIPASQIQLKVVIIFFFFKTCHHLNFFFSVIVFSVPQVKQRMMKVRETEITMEVKNESTIQEFIPE